MPTNGMPMWQAAGVDVARAGRDVERQPSYHVGRFQPSWEVPSPPDPSATKGWVTTSQFWIDSGGFEIDLDIPTRQHKLATLSIRPDACCGEPEHRFPYSSFDGMRGCCAQKTFWKPESCCVSGKVVAKDQCPNEDEEEGFTYRELM